MAASVQEEFSGTASVGIDVDVEKVRGTELARLFVVLVYGELTY